MRVAALYDIHANPVALRTVLAPLPAAAWTATMIDRAQRVLAGVEQRLVVCGHTHAQSDRMLGGVRVVNAGSVGMPLEGRAGAFWALVGPDVRLRRTDYDIRAAEAELRGGGWPGVDDFLRNSPLEPADPLVIAEPLERQAGGT